MGLLLELAIFLEASLPRPQPGVPARRTAVHQDGITRCRGPSTSSTQALPLELSRESVQAPSSPPAPARGAPTHRHSERAPPPTGRRRARTEVAVQVPVGGGSASHTAGRASWTDSLLASTGVSVPTKSRTEPCFGCQSSWHVGPVGKDAPGFAAASAACR